jgi:chromosome segregation ATPase
MSKYENCSICGIELPVVITGETKAPVACLECIVGNLRAENTALKGKVDDLTIDLEDAEDEMKERGKTAIQLFNLLKLQKSEISTQQQTIAALQAEVDRINIMVDEYQANIIPGFRERAEKTESEQQTIAALTAESQGKECAINLLKSMLSQSERELEFSKFAISAAQSQVEALRGALDVAKTTMKSAKFNLDGNWPLLPEEVAALHSNIKLAITNLASGINAINAALSSTAKEE